MFRALFLSAAISALTLSTVVAQENERTFGAWKLRVITDAMTDQARGIATIDGEGGTLVVKCDTGRSREMYVSFVSDSYLGALRNSGRDVMVRFGSAGPVNQSWYHDGSTASLLDKARAQSFIGSLLGSDRLAMRLTTYDYDSVNVSFADLSGGREAISGAYVACGQAFPFTNEPVAPAA